MTKQVTSIPKTAHLDEAAMAMSKFSVRHVVVLDESGKLSGVVSIRDIISEEKTIKTLNTSVF